MRREAQEPSPGLSILLIGPMLWTRIVPSADGLSIVTHLAGAERSDVVIVTDEPVVAALAAGRITAQLARRKGLLRLYGPVDGQVSVADWLDGGKPDPMASSQMPASERACCMIRRLLKEPLIHFLRSPWPYSGFTI